MTYNSKKGVLEFTQYVERVYVGSLIKKPLFNTIDLSLYDRCLRGEPLTTNNCEGWHRGLNFNVQETKPKL
jgi:hypothetical protein